jgi:hypothetical protein
VEVGTKHALLHRVAADRPRFQNNKAAAHNLHATRHVHKELVVHLWGYLQDSNLLILWQSRHANCHQTGGNSAQHSKEQAGCDIPPYSPEHKQ